VAALANHKTLDDVEGKQPRLCGWDQTFPIDASLRALQNGVAAAPNGTCEMPPPADTDGTCDGEQADASEMPDSLPCDAPAPSGTLDLAQACESLAAADPNLTCNFERTANWEQTVADGTPEAVARPRTRPSKLENVNVPGYAILEELGRGGMGVVYKALHLRLQRLVALKMVLAGAHVGKHGLARFRAEAEVVAQLQHPNIVQIYETGEHEGRLYFSLEFVDGGSLDQHMRTRPTTPRSAAELLETLARTMDVAHERGIVHRDLKPGNILLSSVGHGTSSASKEKKPPASGTSHTDHGHRTSEFFPKIADFGLAKRVNEDSSQTQTGTVLGTPSYMAPEQAEGKNREIGPAADIYALGVIFYALLVGRPPFKAENPIDTIRQVIDQEPVPPRQLEPRVPHDLETICLKCLEKAPARRYATAGELANDLRRFLNGEPIQARPTPAWERAWKWGKRRPAIVALIGVSFLAVAAMVLMVMWHNVSLRGQLDDALAEERLAKEREQQVNGEKLLGDARVAVAARDWPAARLHLAKALATIGKEARFAPVKDASHALLRQVERELRVEDDRRASQERLYQFGKLRDEAQFLGTLYTGMDLAANLKAARVTVAKALAVYGVAVDNDSRPTLDEYLTDLQKTEINEDCYQLLLILAETQAQDKEFRQALGCLEQALRFGAATRAYHLRRARYLDQRGDKLAAAEADKAAQGAAVVHVLDHFLVADEFYRRENYAEAIEEFNQVLERKPGHFWANYFNALCLLRQRRHAEARTQLSACLARRDDYVWLYIWRAYAQGEMQAFDAADADYQKALKLPLDEYARYVLFVNRGVLRVQQGRFDHAIADLKTAIALKPKEYQAYVNMALVYRGLKNLDLALDQLNRAVELEPALARVYRLRARLHLERNEPALALTDFDRAIEREDPKSPFHADDLVDRGRLLLRDRKYAAALESFDTALTLNKDHGPGQRLRAEALFHLGRYPDVVKAFDRYLEKGKELESVYRGRGLARAELGLYPSAIEDYTRALELNATSAVHTYRGWAHLVCEAPKLALRDFELAIKLDPKNGDACSGRGFIRASQGQHADAIRDAEASLKHGPKSARLLYNAARIYAQCGEANALPALELIEQALFMLAPEQRAAFWATHVRNDAALQAIRRHVRFLQLDAAMPQRK
jgi:serine/threonine protein kinase/Tfp pilus assembly protein PilF